MSKSCNTCNHSLENLQYPCIDCYEFFHWEHIKPPDKLAQLLQSVDAEIEKSKMNPMAAMGMIVVRRIILEMMEGDEENE